MKGKEDGAIKIGILQTAANNCAKLDELVCKYPDARIIHYVDECVWEHVEAAGGMVTEKCHNILAADFNKMIEAGCDRLGLLCNLVKPGIEKVRKQVPLPIVVYDDVQAEYAVTVTPDGGKIGVIAMRETPLEPSKRAVEDAARRAGKKIHIEKICVESARSCLRETGDIQLADAYFERCLREHQAEYHAFVIPQIPLTRLMPKIRDMKTPVFDSMEPFLEQLVNHYEDGFENKLTRK